MKAIDSPLRNFENQWVAMSKDYKEVIVSAKTLKLLNRKIEESKLGEQVVVTQVYPFSTIICP